MNPFRPQSKNISNPLSIAAGVTRGKEPLGSVPGVSVPNTQQFSSKQFGFQTITVQPNTPFPLSIEGDYIFIEQTDFPIASAVGSPPLGGLGILSIKDSNNNVLQLTQAGMGYVFPNAFQWLSFNYTGVAALKVQIYIGYGRVQDDAGTRVAVGLGRQAVIFTINRPANANPYAAGQIVGDIIPANIFLRQMSRTPQLGGVITKALITKNNAVVANADFSLWLFLSGASGLIPTADQAAFVFSNTLGLQQQGLIRFPTFVTGGAGSTGSVCELSGIAVPFQTDNNVIASTNLTDFSDGGNLCAALVANAAYVPAAGEAISIMLFTDKY